MTKQSGLGDNLYVGGYNISGDIGSLDKIGGGPKPLDVTGIDKSAMERLGGVRDGGMDFMSFYNTSAGQEHAVFSVLPTADVVCTYARGTALGNGGAALVAKQLSYDPKRAIDGMLTFKVNMTANGYGLEWGVQGTPGIRTDTAATNGTALDYLASAAFGLQAYLQVFSFTGTSCTVKLQDSTDNVTFADVVGGSFGAQTALGASRIATAGNLTVNRYVRVVTTGTFSSCAFAVLICRNDVAEAF